MSLGHSNRPAKAAAILFLTTTFWGTSFLLMKALGQHQHALSPRSGTLLVSSLSLFIRFGLGAVVMLALNFRASKHVTRLEFGQGLGLGVFGGIGIVLQMDGVLYTPASTSAFLTQCYCIFIPVFVACHRRAWPSRTLAASCAMVLAGVGVLSGFRFDAFHLGRGEAEAILGSLFFTVQILWLERPRYSGNRSGQVTLVMFTVLALLVFPVVCLSGSGPREWITLYSSPVALGIVGFLTLVCTLLAYGLMNKWQPHIPATQASLIYCCEPMFTSLFALFLPAMLSRWVNISYANETITPRLILGGGLITGANLLVLWQASRLKGQIPSLEKDLQLSNTSALK